MPSYGSFSSYSNYTNNALFKVGLAAASFFVGALVGAYAPDLVFSRPASTVGGAPGGPKEETAEDDAPLCVGPECATMPPPKLPAAAILLASPSPYHASRLTAFRDTAASSNDTSQLERYALITHFMALHSHPYHPTATAAATEQLTTLTSSSQFTSHFTLTHSTDTTLSRLRQSATQGALALCRVQVAGEARWVAVVGVDAFYVYVIDNYSDDCVLFVTGREFSKAWTAADESGSTVAGEAWFVASKAAAAAGGTVTGEKKGVVQSRQLKPLLMAEPAAAQTHVVEIASL